ALEGEQLLAGRAVPELDRPVRTPGSQALAVRAERNARDPGMLEGAQLLAGRAVPNLHRLVIAPRYQPLAIRAEIHALDQTGMPPEGPHFGMTKAGQVVPLEPPQVSATRLLGHLCEQLAGAADIVLFPGTLSQLHAGRIRRKPSLIALFDRLGLGI